MKKSILIIIGIIFLWFLLNLAGINMSVAVPRLVEWSTKYIAPWIFIYLLFRLVRAVEAKGL